MYSELLKWARQSAENGVQFDKQEYPTRETLVKQLRSKLDMDGLEPTVKRIELPKSKTMYDLVLLDIRQAIYSLLTDAELMVPENLLFPNGDPFSVPTNPDEWGDAHIIRDVNDGSVWYEAYQLYVKDPKRDVLCPIILFIDKTFLDRNSEAEIRAARSTNSRQQF